MESKATFVNMTRIGNDYIMLDSDNHIVLSNIKKIEKLGQIQNKDRWRITLSDRKETIITEDGLFYNRAFFSCKEYDFVQLLTYDISDCYLVKKNGKYGIILCKYDGSTSFLYQTDYDDIEALEVNHYLYGKSVNYNYIRITQNGYSFVHILSAGLKSKFYNNIIIPPQPLSQWIVELNHKYGLINLLGEEIIEPTYDSISDLCTQNNLSLHLQTDNLYENREIVKIKRIIDYKKHISTFIDESGMIKGNFCYHEKFEDREGIVEYEILKYPAKRETRVARCNRLGFYFDVFDAKVFDFVECLSDEYSLYLCEISGRYGLLDKNLNPILDLVYKDIIMLNRDELLLLVTTDCGMFIYDIKEKTKSKTYEFIYSSTKRTFIFKSNGKYGIIDKNGNILIPNNYKLSSADKSMQINSFRSLCNEHPFVLANYAGQQYPIYIEDDKYYGSVNRVYDECIKIRSFYFIVKQNNKYGIIRGDKEILKPIYDHIFLFNEKPDYQLLSYNIRGNIIVSFVILKKDGLYSLFNMCNGVFVLSECEEIRLSVPPTHDHFNRYSDKWAPSFIAKKNGKYGLLDKWGTQKLDFEWDNIIPGCKGFIVTYNKKRGYYTFSNGWLTDCIYDEFITTSWSIKGVINGKEEEIETGFIQEVKDYYNNRSIEEDPPTYNRYSGSYAQDEMDYSDDDIDTIFDGDPDAYWNID